MLESRGSSVYDGGLSSDKREIPAGGNGFCPSFGGNPRSPALRVFPGMASVGQGLVGICAETHGGRKDDMLLSSSHDVLLFEITKTKNEVPIFLRISRK